MKIKMHFLSCLVFCLWRASSITVHKGISWVMLLREQLFVVLIICSNWMSDWKSRSLLVLSCGMPLHGKSHHTVTQYPHLYTCKWIAKVILGWCCCRAQLLVVPIIRSNWMSDNTQSYAAPPATVFQLNQVSLVNIYLCLVRIEEAYLLWAHLGKVRNSFYLLLQKLWSGSLVDKAQSLPLNGMIWERFQIALIEPSGFFLEFRLHRCSSSCRQVPMQEGGLVCPLMGQSLTLTAHYTFCSPITQQSSNWETKVQHSSSI